MFEEYLKEIHAKTYSGLDDNMSDSFEKWVSCLDLADLIEYGNDAMDDLVKNDKQNI